MSNLKKLLDAGVFVVCGEMSPPAGPDKSVILRKCSYFKDYVDAVNLTDNQTAIVRMSSLMSSIYVMEGGCEPIMQLTCRDRNRLGLQSELFSAYSAGVRNVLCLTGDYQTFGNHPQAKGVFDLDSVQLIHTVAGMNQGRLLCGEEFKPAVDMFIGGAGNPFAEPLDFRIIRLGKKITAGVNFIQTQAVFDLPKFDKWMELVRNEGYDQQVHIIPGVMPVRSANALKHMIEDVPGMSIADEYIRRMESAPEPKEEGIRICLEIIDHIRNTKGVHGVHIMPVMWESILPQVVERAGLLPRPRIDSIPEAGDSHEQV